MKKLHIVRHINGIQPIGMKMGLETIKTTLTTFNFYNTNKACFLNLLLKENQKFSIFSKSYKNYNSLEKLH